MHTYTAFDYLAAGQSSTLTYTVAINDGESSDNIGTQTFTINITGTNDAPVIDTAVSTNFQGSLTEDATTPDLVSTGVVPFTDVDLTNTHTTSTSLVSTATSPTVTIPTATLTALNTALASVVSNTSTGDGAGTIDWTFTLANSLTQFLQNGQTLTVVYNLTVTDSSSPAAASDTEQVTITITGTNDAPVIDTAVSTNFQGSLTEDATTPDLVSTGVVPFTDVDLTNTHTTSTSLVSTATSPTVTIPTATLTALNTALASVVSNTSTGDGAGTIDWTFTLANSLTQFLQNGQTLTVVYNLTVTDSSSPAAASDTEQVTITITGTNDAPVIDTAVSTNFQGSLTEDATTPDLVSTGVVPFTDVDLTNTHTTSTSLVSTATSPTVTIPTATLTALNTALASVVSNTSTGDGAGTIDWTFTLANSLTQFLQNGQTLTVVYNLTVTDSSSPAAASDTEQVTITITGTNDAPVIDTAVSTNFQGSLTEDATTPDLVSTGVVPFTDVDLTNTHTTSTSLVSTATSPTVNDPNCYLDSVEYGLGFSS